MSEDEIWDYMMKRADHEANARQAMLAWLASAAWADANRSILHKMNLRQAFEAGYHAAADRRETR